MRELRETILRQGQCVGDSIVKVDMFLNHRLDTRLMFAMGRELADYFGKDKPDIVLTVEASGIALALAAAHFLDDIPVVFAKKSPAANQSADMLTAVAHSFTHGNDNALRVDRPRAAACWWGTISWPMAKPPARGSPLWSRRTARWWA